MVALGGDRRDAKSRQGDHRAIAADRCPEPEVITDSAGAALPRDPRLADVHGGIGVGKQVKHRVEHDWGAMTRLRAYRDLAGWPGRSWIKG